MITEQDKWYAIFAAEVANGLACTEASVAMFCTENGLPFPVYQHIFNVAINGHTIKDLK